jgi:type II secretory ATPase GspE/PulE/Tfp pilus assembly ATPase PilB-like protein
MIGEIIDKETAAAAANLARVGRFVLAGLQAHNLPAALSFFQDLGVASSLFSESASLAITQRLAARNCPHCLKQQRIGRDSLKKLSEKIALKKLLPLLKRDKIISEKINKPEDLIFYKSSGCQRCHNSGVAGKIGIFEVLEITPAVKNIIKTGHFSALRQETEKQGGHTLAEDALIKSLTGLIPIDEVFRIIDKA